MENLFYYISFAANYFKFIFYHFDGSEFRFVWCRAEARKKNSIAKAEYESTHRILFTQQQQQKKAKTYPPRFLSPEPIYFN